MNWVDSLWIGLVLVVWVFTQIVMIISIWRLWRHDEVVEKREQLWDDRYDNWYPDYPFNDSKVKRERGITGELKPDKHEEEE